LLLEVANARVQATTGEVPLVRLETEVSRMPNEEPRNSTASALLVLAENRSER
jgi:hypothetical protein